MVLQYDRRIVVLLLLVVYAYSTELEEIKFETSLLEKQLEFARLELAESRVRHEIELRKAALSRAHELTGSERNDGASAHDLNQIKKPSHQQRRGIGGRARRRPRGEEPSHDASSPPLGKTVSNARQKYLWDGVSTDRRKVVVVVYNKIRGYLDWLREDFVDSARKMCSTECVFTSDRKQVLGADAVVFHAKTHSGQDFPRHRGKGKYIIVSLEQERYAPLLKQPKYISKFDATATFHLDSTLPMITIPPHWTADAYFETEKKMIPWDQKINAAVAFISNCRNAGAEDRLDFVRRLSQVYEVHSYGRCLHNKDEPPLKQGESRSDAKRRIISKYKFYLSLENNKDAKDYVSEKVFEGILAGSLPVYRGTDSVNKLLPAPDSILNTRDYQDNVDAIAHRLSHLATNISAYNTYFQWRTTPRDTPTARAKFQQVLDMTAYKYTALCRICAYATEEPQSL